jgi:hypothetical protein
MSYETLNKLFLYIFLLHSLLIWNHVYYLLQNLFILLNIMTCHRYHWELESSHDPDHHNHSDVYIVENILKIDQSSYLIHPKCLGYHDNNECVTWQTTTNKKRCLTRLWIDRYNLHIHNFKLHNNELFYRLIITYQYNNGMFKKERKSIKIFVKRAWILC